MTCSNCALLILFAQGSHGPGVQMRAVEVVYFGVFEERRGLRAQIT